MTKLRATVYVGPEIPPRKKAGRRKIFGYSYATLAKLFEMSESGVRTAAARGYFDPHNLESVIAYANERTQFAQELAELGNSAESAGES